MARMELPVVDKFCFCIDLKTGCLAMSMINCTFSFVQILVLAIFAVEIKNGLDIQTMREDNEAAMTSVVYTIVIMLDVLVALKFLCDLVFLFAVYKENCRIMKKYCIVWIIFLVMFIIGFLKSIFQMDGAYVISHLIFLAENFYFIIVVRSYLLSINEDGVL